MGIRQMSRRPCPDCQDETLHLAQRCTGCGRIDINASQAASLWQNRRMAKLRHRLGRDGACFVANAQKAGIGVERRQWMKETGNRVIDAKGPARG